MPLPTAAADHQTHNARVLSDAGAALLLPEAELTGERLGGEVATADERCPASRGHGRRGPKPRPTERVAGDSVQTFDAHSLTSGLLQSTTRFYISSFTMALFDSADRRPVHFMGIGGAGMSGLALIACRRGVAVTGCDADPAGAQDLVGARRSGRHRPLAWRTSRVREPWSTPRRSSRTIRSCFGPERSGLPVVPRKVALAELVGGTHGGGGERHARQDHDDGDGHRGARGRGARSYRNRRAVESDRGAGTRASPATRSSSSRPTSTTRRSSRSIPRSRS